MPKRNVATNFTFEQQRQEINLIASDLWDGVLGGATTDFSTVVGWGDHSQEGYLKADGSVSTTAAFTFGNKIIGPSTFTIEPTNVNGTVVIAGNLQVDGTQTAVNSTTMDVTDLNITVAKGAANAAAADTAGITVDGANATLQYEDGSPGTWESSLGFRLDGRNASAGLKLNLAGSADYLIKESTTDDIVQFGGTGAANFFAHNLSSGNFGIAEANPSYKLDVNGTLRVTGSSTFGANGSITSGGNFTLSGNGLTVTGSTTAVGEFKGATQPTVQITQTTDNTDLQLRANATGGLVRTAGVFPLILGTSQEERLRIHESNAFVTINHGNAETNSALILSKTDAGYAKLEFDVGTSQKAYVELNSSETLVHYGAAGTQQQFYTNGNGTPALTIDTSQKAIFNGSVEIPARINSGGALETHQSDNWFKVGTISTLGGGNRVHITILGTAGYGQSDQIVGHTIINITRDNGSTQGVRGHFYGVGTTDSYGGISEVATKPTGTNNQFDVYVKPSAHYSNLGCFVDISTGAATWEGSTTDTGSSSQPTSSTLLQKDWGILIGGSQKLGIDTNGNATFGGDINLSEGKKTIFGSNSGNGAYVKHQSGHLEIKNETGNLYFDNLGGIRIRTGASYGTALWVNSDLSTKIGDSGINHAHLCQSGNNHSIVGQAADNVAALEVYSQHGSSANKLSFGVYDNRTGSKSASFLVRGDGSVEDSKGNLRRIPRKEPTSGTSYTLVADDSGRVITHGATIVMAANGTFTHGDAITIYNYSASGITIDASTNSALLHWTDGTTAATGDRTLASRGVATLLCVEGTNNTWVITGSLT